MKKLFCVLLVLFVFGCATAPVTIQQLEQKTGSRVLSEEEIKNRLVEKDLTGTFTEFNNLCNLHLYEDGKAKGSSINMDSTGTWQITKTEAGLPMLVMNWNSSWGTEKGVLIEKNGRIDLVSQSGIAVYKNIR
jgi:hypothetical protein